MKLPRHKFLHLAAGAMALATSIVGLSDNAWSQARAIKIVVTFPLGSGGDLLTRAIADQISRAHGVTIAVENQAAEAGMESVARAAPDGNTLVVINNNFVVDSHFRKLRFDPLTDFEPLCNLASVQELVVVSASSPYRSLPELIAAARQKPGEVTMAINPGSITHMGMEALKRAANVSMPVVSAPGANTALGNSPSLLAVVNGQATWSMHTYQNSMVQIKDGKARALAVASRQRLQALPDIPTVSEAGYKDYDLDFWDGVFAPTGTPKERIGQLMSWFGEAAQQPEVKTKIGPEAFMPVGVCGADFVAGIRKQHDEYGRIIREGNIKLQ
jgi:tripartite-type tricarboxylate transporter receptor subunit TctC